MARIGDLDYRSVLAAVQAVAGVTTRQEFGPVLLSAVATLVRCDVISLNEVDPAAGFLEFLTEPEHWPYPAGSEEIFAELAAQHPLIRHHLETGDGSAIKISDLLTEDEWHETELYRRFYRPMNVEYQLSITLPAPAPIVVGIAFNRSDRDFDERDRAVLNLARPYLAQSWRQVREQERLRRLIAAASDALSAAHSGVVVLGDPVHELTGGALVTLYRFFGRPGVRDPLPPRVRQWLSGQQQRTDTAEDRLQLAKPLRATLDGRQLLLRYLPRGVADDDVILLDERPLDAPPTALQAVGLSAREAEVLRLLTDGCSNAELARRLSVSPWTIKRHLANIYAKLGVNGRVGAATMALEIDAHHDAS